MKNLIKVMFILVVVMFMFSSCSEEINLDKRFQKVSITERPYVNLDSTDLYYVIVDQKAHEVIIIDKNDKYELVKIDSVDLGDTSGLVFLLIFAFFAIGIVVGSVSYN